MPTYMTKVGATYYFRRAVPDELLGYFLTNAGNPRVEWMESLRTKDRRTAERALHRRSVEVEELISEAEARLRAGIPPERRPANSPPAPFEPFRSEADQAGLEVMERHWIEADARTEADPVKQQIADALQADRLRREQDDRALMAEVREQARTARRVPLMPLFDKYVAERQPEPASVKAFRRVMSHLIDFRHDDAASITKADVIAWKEALLAERSGGKPVRSARTVKETYLAALKVVLGFGVENGELTENVAKDVTVRVPTKVRLRKPQFTDEEATTILRAALQPQPDSLSPEHRLARRWVPWLCAYTGARVNEMTQLRAQDVRQEEGIWTLLITPEAGSVKGRKARVVPIHEHLIEQGFLDVVKANGSGPLFYNPKRGRGGSEGNPHHKKMGERLAAWVRKIGVNDPNVQPNHAWRHLFKAIGRRVRMDPHAVGAITGHAPGTEGDKYGAPELPVLAEELKLFPRFDVKGA